MKHVLSFFHITLVVGLLCCGSLVGYATASSGNNDGDEFTSPDSITVATDKSVYTPGEAIEVSITYWNTSESADTLTAVGCFTGFCIDTLEYSPNCTSWFWSCLPVITTYIFQAHSSYTWSTADGTLDGMVDMGPFSEGTHFVAGWIGDGFDATGGQYFIGHTTFTVQPLVSVGGELEATPREFALYQNHPNPFNPSTVIRYSLPADSYVTLKVFNIVGQEVATLVEEMQEPGYKSAEWDAINVPSGMYYYRLTTGSFSDVKKLLLIK